MAFRLPLELEAGSSNLPGHSSPRYPAIAFALGTIQTARHPVYGNRQRAPSRISVSVAKSPR